MIRHARRLWGRIWLKGVQYSGRYDRLDWLYLFKDPWELANPLEAQRFSATNALLSEVAPDCASLLEVGCGEGAQTQWLQQVCTSVTGIDVSERAIARARVAMPETRFAVVRAEDAERHFSGERFDCAVLCEVLYYAADPAAVLAAMQQLTGRIVVTVFAPRLARLEHLFAAPGWRECAPITAGDTRWACYFWQRP